MVAGFKLFESFRDIEWFELQFLFLHELEALLELGAVDPLTVHETNSFSVDERWYFTLLGVVEFDCADKQTVDGIAAASASAALVFLRAIALEMRSTALPALYVFARAIAGAYASSSGFATGRLLWLATLLLATVLFEMVLETAPATWLTVTDSDGVRFDIRSLDLGFDIVFPLGFNVLDPVFPALRASRRFLLVDGLVRLPYFFSRLRHSAQRHLGQRDVVLRHRRIAKLDAFVGQLQSFHHKLGVFVRLQRNRIEVFVQTLRFVRVCWLVLDLQHFRHLVGCILRLDGNQRPLSAALNQELLRFSVALQLEFVELGQLLLVERRVRRGHSVPSRCCRDPAHPRFPASSGP